MLRLTHYIEALGNKAIGLVSCWRFQIFAVCILITWFLLPQRTADPDLFARVAMGKLIAQYHSVPVQDPFAWTAKRDTWVDHEWLSGLVFYPVAIWGGDTALFLLKLIFVWLSVWLLLAAQRSYAGQSAALLPWSSLCVLGAAYVWASTVRAQVFTYLFLPLWLWVFVSVEQRGKWPRLWILPLSMILWCNSHGGFVVGLGLLGIFSGILSLTKMQGRKALVGAFIACIVATAVNPYGFRSYWYFIIEAITMPRPTIPEWWPTSLGSARGQITLTAVIIMAWGALLCWWNGSGTARGKIDPISSVFLAVSALFAFRSQRFPAILFMLAAVYGSKYYLVLAEWVKLYCSRRWNVLANSSAMVYLACVILAAGSVFSEAFQFRHFKLDYSGYPVQAVEWLHRFGNGGRLLNSFDSGSYALWRLFPKYQISLDGRYEEVYPESTLELVQRAVHPFVPGHEEALQELRPDYVLTPRIGAKPGEWPGSWDGYQLLYFDSHYAVFGQAVPGDKSLLPTNEVNVWQERSWPAPAPASARQ